MVAKYKSVLVVAIIFIVVGVVLSVFTAQQKVVIFKTGDQQLATNMVSPEMLSAEPESFIVFPSRGYLETIHIKTVATGDFTLEFEARHPRVVREQRLSFSAKDDECSVDETSRQISCNRIIVNPDQLKEYRFKGSPSELQSLEFSLIKEKRVVAIPNDPDRIKLVGLILLLMIPVIWFTHRWRALSQWLIVATSVAVISLINLWFAVALLFVLSLTFLLNVIYVRGAKAKWFFFSSILLSFSFLLLFKYGQEILHTLWVDLGQFGLALPLGLSYFVIRVIDTQLKWYRKEIKGISLREYLCFVIFPATIPAGPIDTVDNFHKNRLERITSNDVVMGVGRIALGLFKKLVIADFFLFSQLYGGSGSLFYEVSINIDEVAYSQLFFLLLGNFLFAYIDFSAYSDMAIGLSRLFGYKMIENFNLPIFAHSIREYWRRWHLSLSMWCMRNIYFPLMVKTRNPYMPLYVVMAAVGLWHMLNLSWFTWSIHHASCLAFYAYFEGKLSKKIKFPKLHPWLKRVLGVALTVFVVSLGHSFVVYADYNYAVKSYFTMLGLN